MLLLILEVEERWADTGERVVVDVVVVAVAAAVVIVIIVAMIIVQRRHEVKYFNKLSGHVPYRTVTRCNVMHCVTGMRAKGST
jgi:hypothetical protein